MSIHFCKTHWFNLVVLSGERCDLVWGRVNIFYFNKDVKFMRQTYYILFKYELGVWFIF